jgi:hypothetical protein
MALKVASGSSKSKTERNIPTTCIYWLAGRCNRNPCRFLHSQTPSSCNAAANAGYNSRKRHSSSYGVLHNETSYNAKKQHSSYVYQKSFPKHNAKTVVNKMIGDDKDRTQLVTETNKTIDDRDNAQVAEVSQNPSPSICKYWVNDSCVHGDQCRNLHSWFYGDGFATIAKLQGHKKVHIITIYIPIDIYISS